MEGWDSAVNDAGEIFTNATDERIRSRASRVVTWLKAHPPVATPPASAGAVGGEYHIEHIDTDHVRLTPIATPPASGEAVYEGTGCVFCDLNTEHRGNPCTATPPAASGVDEAFAEAMKGRIYGDRETANARAWFVDGWNARLAAVAPAAPGDEPTVERWSCQYGGGMDTDPNGDWVPYGDYKRLLDRLAAVAPAGMVLRDAARYEHLRERFAETMLDSLFGIDQDPCIDSTVQLDAAVDADMADDALHALLAPTPPATAGEE